MVRLKSVSRLKILSLQIGEKLVSDDDDFTVERVIDGWVCSVISQREAKSMLISYISILK